MKGLSHHFRSGLTALSVLGTALLLAACAPTPQTVSLDANPEVGEERPGDGQSVALRVQDLRSMEILGYRDRERGVAVTSEPSVARGVERGLTRALEAQGFTVTDWDPDAERRLDVQVRRFEYERSGGFFRRFTSVTAEMEAVGHRGGDRARADVSSSSTDQAFLFGPSAERNQELVQRVLDRSVSRIASERDLIRILERDD